MSRTTSITLSQSPLASSGDREAPSRVTSRSASAQDVAGGIRSKASLGSRIGRAICGGVFGAVFAHRRRAADKARPAFIAEAAKVDGEMRTEAWFKPLCAPIPRGLAADKDLIARLVAHAESQGSLGEGKLDAEEIGKLVAAGERIQQALSAESGLVTKDGQLTVSLGANDIRVPSNQWTCRAIAWHAMACAARMDDLDPTREHMVTNGCLLMKDPGQRIFNFLKAGPLADERISTHYPDRTRGKQCGIDDYQGLLPGQGKALLFGSLNDPASIDSPDTDLFFKIEGAGFPNANKKIKGESERMQKARVHLARWERSRHVMSFIDTRFPQESTKGGHGVVAQEHVYKGVLKKEFSEFKTLVAAARKKGYTKTTKSQADSMGRKRGLVAVDEQLESIRVNPKTDAETRVRIAALREKIGQKVGVDEIECETANGIAAVMLPVARGAEVRIPLNVR